MKIRDTENRIHDFSKATEERTLPFIIETSIRLQEGALPNLSNTGLIADIDCSDNPDITDMKNFPLFIKGRCDISKTQIQSLKGAPQYILGGLNLEGTPLAEHLQVSFLTPQAYRKEWSKQNSVIPSFFYNGGALFPNTDMANRLFVVENLNTLQSKKTKVIDLRFDLNNHNLIVLHDFSCANKSLLQSLKNGPLYVGGNYDCSNTQIQSLKGGLNPSCLGGEFICINTPLSKKLGKEKLSITEYRTQWEKDNNMNRNVIIMHTSKRDR